jgi:hypothetical protein
MSGLRDSNPIVPLAILPLPLSLGLVLDVEPHPVSVHHVVFELSDVLVTVGEVLGAFTLHLSLVEVSFVP